MFRGYEGIEVHPPNRFAFSIKVQLYVVIRQYVDSCKSNCSEDVNVLFFSLLYPTIFYFSFLLPFFFFL